MGAITVQEQPEVSLTTEAVQEALDTSVEVPEDCICDYVVRMPYNLQQRVVNPKCTAHESDDLELERERD